MRVTIDEAGTYFELVKIAMKLEDELSITISDTELEGIKTLRQIATVVQRHLPASSDVQTRALELTQDAARICSSGNADPVAVDAPLLDALVPNRWTLPAGQASVAPNAGV
jgi:hypothetical protein